MHSTVDADAGHVGAQPSAPPGDGVRIQDAVAGVEVLGPMPCPHRLRRAHHQDREVQTQAGVEPDDASVGAGHPTGVDDPAGDRLPFLNEIPMPARPPRPGNGAPRSEMPNAINAPGTAMPAINDSGAATNWGRSKPVTASAIPSTDPRITGLRTGCETTRRQDGWRPDSTMSSTTKAMGASTTNWYNITGAT